QTCALPIYALVGDEQVGAEPDDGDGQPALRGEPKQLLHLCGGAGPSERARRAAGPERRVAGELDALLDRHASTSSSFGAARSTSPAPRVRTMSPSCTHDATSATASSSAGAQPMRIPGRTTA